MGGGCGGDVVERDLGEEEGEGGRQRRAGKGERWRWRRAGKGAAEAVGKGATERTGNKSDGWSVKAKRSGCCCGQDA